MAAALVLGALHELGDHAVEALAPTYTHTIAVLDNRFSMSDVRVSHAGGSEILRFRANLAEPVLVGSKEVDPFGWAGRPEGGFQITYTVGGSLQLDALLLIVVLAWPARSAREMAWRMGVAVLPGGMLLLLDVPITIVAELHNYLATVADPNGGSGWMIASRFLMGGGGAVIALVAALLAILAGQHLSDSQGHASGTGRWRSVSRQEFDAFFRTYPRALEVSPPFEQPARHRMLHDPSLGRGRDSWVAECRTRGRQALYRIRTDRAAAP